MSIKTRLQHYLEWALVPFPNGKPSSIYLGSSETGCEVGILRRRSHEYCFFQPVSTQETVDDLLQICRQGLQDNMANGSSPRQSGTDCIQQISGLIWLPGGLPWLPFTVRFSWGGVSKMCTGTWTRGGTLCRFCLWQMAHKMTVWRRPSKMLCCFFLYCWGASVRMRFYNHRQSYISTVWAELCLPTQWFLDVVDMYDCFPHCYWGPCLLYE